MSSLRRRERESLFIFIFFEPLRTFPAFIGELESLEILDLRYNDFEVDAAALDALLKRCRRLCDVHLTKPAGPWTAESLAHLGAFKAKLFAENPNAKVSYEFDPSYEDKKTYRRQ